MRYNDNYGKYLSAIDGDIVRCKREDRYPVFAYTSDLDVLLKWDVEVFNSLLSRLSIEEISFRSGDTIQNLNDFGRIFSYHAIHGLGGECDILSLSVCSEIEALFDYSYALGGTGAQGAAALGAVGIPLVAHITDRSREVCELMNYDTISFVENGRRVGSQNHVSGLPPVRHMILQFNKGDEIRVNGITYTVPVSNRLIMDYDTIHKVVPIDQGFIDFCERNAESITSFDISGFNAILDLQIASERLTFLRKHFERIRQKNGRTIIYLESAHYFNPEVKELVFREASSFIDILGMNEEELVDLAGKLKIDTDIGNIESVVRALSSVESAFKIPGIVLHTKDYSLYCGAFLSQVDMEKGLTLGNLLSGTRARTGRYGSREDCKESLQMTLSPIGVTFYENLQKIADKPFCVLVPSRYMEKPACTIGLGDSFVAGVQTSFL